MITFTKHNASGKSWSQNWYNAHRDGTDTGFSAYENADGTFRLSRGDHSHGEFKTLEEVKAYVEGRAPSFEEKCLKLGLVK